VVKRVWSFTDSILVRLNVNDDSSIVIFRLLGKAVKRLGQHQAEGKEYHDAWNATSVELVKAAEVKTIIY